MFNNKYFKTALGIYISYGMLGMILIILSCNMSFLKEQFNTDSAGISFLISMEGLVRSCTLYIAGRLSDKLGRKKFLWIAPIFMAVFLIGVPLAPTYEVALIVSGFAGVAHAFMDAGSYPTLMECFPKTAGTANIIIKLFVALGGAILPFIIAFFVGNDMFYGYTFFLVAFIMLLNGIFIFTRKFPPVNTINKEDESALVSFNEEPILKKEGITLTIIGFTSNAIFMGFQTWIPTYAQNVLGMDQVTSLKFISYYSFGAIVSVLVMAKLLQRTIKPVTVLVIYPLMGVTFLILLLFVRTQLITTIGFFLIGISSAGVLQMAQTTMGELFWRNKGATIALVSTASGVAAAVIPGLTGMILRYYDIIHVFYFMFIVYVIAIICAVFTRIRYSKIITKNSI
jgi:MFS family permease